MILTTFMILSTLTFLVLTFIWSTDDIFNVLLRVLFAVLSVLGIGLLLNNSAVFFAIS